ncbi:MAG: hypothetical protein Q4F23_01625 [Coriobacteriia bacterium]|nr:hypothetical protein [Coriobacteriia bacterium]
MIAIERNDLVRRVVPALTGSLPLGAGWARCLDGSLLGGFASLAWLRLGLGPLLLRLFHKFWDCYTFEQPLECRERVGRRRSRLPAILEVDQAPRLEVLLRRPAVALGRHAP